MFGTPNAGFAGVFVMDEVPPQATQMVLKHLLGCGCLEVPMTPIDTSSWFPQEADIDSLVRHLEKKQ
jgi:hypothetical protein